MSEYGKPRRDPDETAVTGPLNFENETRLGDLPLMPPPPPSFLATAGRRVEDTMVDGQRPLSDLEHLDGMLAQGLGMTDTVAGTPLPPGLDYGPLSEPVRKPHPRGTIEPAQDWPGPQYVTPGKVIRDDTHLREVVRDELGKVMGDGPFEAGMRVAEEHPFTIDGVRMEVGDMIDLTASPDNIPTEFLPHNVFDFITTTHYAIRVKTKSGAVYIGKWRSVAQYAKDWKEVTGFLEETRAEEGQFVLAMEEGVAFVLTREVESITFFSRQWHEAEYQQRREGSSYGRRANKSTPTSSWPTPDGM